MKLMVLSLVNTITISFGVLVEERSLVAKEVLKGGAKTSVPHGVKAGFNNYSYGGWEMIYNPSTKEVWHLQPIR